MSASASIASLRDALIATRDMSRAVAQMQVDLVAGGMRSGLFAAAGYKRPESAVAQMLSVDRGVAREIVRVASFVCPQGAEPPPMPAMAVAFHEGRAGLRHVDLVGRVLDGDLAQRLPAEVWALVEQQVAAVADECSPRELERFARELVESCDRQSSVDDDEPACVNEAQVTRLPCGGVKLVARIEDPVDAAVLLTLLDAKSAPRDAADQRDLGRRQADALVEGCAFVLAHGENPDLPSGGIARLNVHMQLTDLEDRLRAASLDLGDTLTPTAARRLCCDAGVVPIVLDGAGQPLDVGRSTRAIPDGIRRAVTARDRGCAHPGCDRPPSWSEIHHIHEWAQGGAPRLDNLVMLCRIHHREIHTTGSVTIAADGLPEFTPPAWLDARQRTRHHRRVALRPHQKCAPRPGTYPPGERANNRRRSVSRAPH